MKSFFQFLSLCGILLDASGERDYFADEFARAHGMWTYEPRQGRNAATVVCSAFAVVTLVFFASWRLIFPRTFLRPT